MHNFRVRLLVSIAFIPRSIRFLLFGFHRMHVRTHCTARCIGYDTHDLRFSKRGFFPALSRRQRDHRGQRGRPEVSRGTGCGRFYRKLAEKLVPVRNNAHTRAVTRAGTMRR